jgi:hypothetical protein
MAVDRPGPAARPIAPRREHETRPARTEPSMRTRPGTVALLVVLSMATWPRPAGSAADQASADWRKALSLYKRKKLDLACPLFESAAKAKRNNGAIWGDLGLCELKRGRIPESVHASYLAIRFGSEGVRKAAHFNLHLTSISTGRRWPSQFPQRRATPFRARPSSNAPNPPMVARENGDSTAVAWERTAASPPFPM